MRDISPKFVSVVQSDSELVAASQKGNTGAFGELFLRHHLTVRRLIVSVIGPNAPVDDLTQETFLQAYNSIDRFRSESGFLTWLHRIAVNCSISFLRRKRKHKTGDCSMSVDTAIETNSPSAHDAVLGRELVRRLYRVLLDLSVKRRTAFVLFHIQGHSVEQVANILGVAKATVKSRVFFARREIMKKAAQDAYLLELMEELQNNGTLKQQQ